MKESIIKLFIGINQLIFNFFKCFSKSSKKHVFLCDFGDNAYYTIQALNAKGYDNIIVLRTAKCNQSFANCSIQDEIYFTPRQLVAYIKGLYHLATAKNVLVDNYFPVLQACAFKKGVKCIQLWHAAGAIKKFALCDPSIEGRSATAKKRFEAVYTRISEIVVGSEHMANIFGQAFQQPKSAFLPFGVPRTDFFFDEQAMQQARTRMQQTYPQIQGKKVVVYAPTFRDGQLETQHIPLNFTYIADQLGEQYILLIKLHPAVTNNVRNIQHERIIVADNAVQMNDLLVVCDFLVSDYSSIPFEFAFLKKPQIFYPYDLEDYEKTRGFFENYAKMVTGPVIDSDDELIHTILHMQFDLLVIDDFFNKWHAYSKGTSSSKLAEYLISS